MKKYLNGKFLGVIALAVACMMIGVSIGSGTPRATAETTVVQTSPFTAAIEAVRDSVVGVNNYQIVSTGNSYGNGYGNSTSPWGNYGFGFGNGYGNGYGNYGYGNGNSNNNQKTEEVQYGSGSGVVIAKEYVLTNYHVVEDASSLKVSVLEDGAEEETMYEATLAAYDEDLDVAVLNVPGLPLAPVELGDSDTLQVGDWAICIGNPLGFTGTVTAGIISGLDREISTGTTTDKYGRSTKVVNTMIQTDAAINSGNSGGGMFNTAGQLVGIPTLKYSGTRSSSSASVESIGMCIPINDAKSVIEEALNGTGTAQTATETETESSTQSTDNGLKGKPRMGVTITTLNSAFASAYNLPTGAYVMEVEAGSPAEIAGMQVGDIVVEADGNLITSTTELMNIISAKGEGDAVELTVFRTGVDLTESTDIPDDADYVELTIVLAIVDGVAQ